jgi:hypothetical protein
MEGPELLPANGDPWNGRQPRYLRLIADSGRFALVTALPSGELIAVPLGRPGGASG